MEGCGAVYHTDGLERELDTAAFTVCRIAWTAALGDGDRGPGRHRKRILGVSEPRSVLSLSHRRLYALEMRGNHDLELQQRGDRPQAELHVGHLHDGALSLRRPDDERTDIEERARTEQTGGPQSLAATNTNRPIRSLGHGRGHPRQSLVDEMPSEVIRQSRRRKEYAAQP